MTSNNKMVNGHMISEDRYDGDNKAAMVVKNFVLFMNKVYQVLNTNLCCISNPYESL